MFSKGLAVDLGTSQVRIYVRSRGIILREPTVLAVNRKTGAAQAVGTAALELFNSQPGSISLIRPVSGGVIKDAESAGRILRAVLKKAQGGNPFRPDVVAAVHPGISEVERRALVGAFIFAGVRRVYTVESPAAAAAGAGLIPSPCAVMAADIGAGSSSIAVLSQGRVVDSVSLKVAGGSFDAALSRHLRKNRGLVAGNIACEDIKISIGCLVPREGNPFREIRGRDLGSGFPRSVELYADELLEVFRPAALELADEIRFMLERTAPGFAAEIIKSGVTLAGGSSLLYGLGRFIAENTGIPVTVAENPADCTVTGAQDAYGAQGGHSERRGANAGA